jgi:hypothetical protein
MTVTVGERAATEKRGGIGRALRADMRGYFCPTDESGVYGELQLDSGAGGVRLHLRRICRCSRELRLESVRRDTSARDGSRTARLSPRREVQAPGAPAGARPVGRGAARRTILRWLLGVEILSNGAPPGARTSLDSPHCGGSATSPMTLCAINGPLAPRASSQPSHGCRPSDHLGRGAEARELQKTTSSVLICM